MTESDKELLVLAAKAAGVEGQYVEGYGTGDYYYTGNQDGILCESHDGQMFVWNPLIDDGDALRLAVKLNMGLSIHTGQCDAVAQKGTMQTEKNSDTFAATRRAIVRAAAEIGRHL